MAIMSTNGAEGDIRVLPLDNLKLDYIEGGAVKEVSALHKAWVTDRYFIPYCPPPTPNDQGTFEIGAKETWLERMQTFCQDMKWLLQLKQHQFWSQMLHDPACMATVVSFLQEAFPFYALGDFPSDREMWEAYQEAYRLVLVVIHRLATSRESKTNYMTRQLHGSLIYKYYLLTVPVLLDLCLLCGHSNRPLLLRVFTTAFSEQPGYLDDLRRAGTHITEVLQGVSQCLGLHMPLDSEPAELAGFQEEAVTSPVLQDLVLHVLDTACTLSVLTDVHLPACTLLHQQCFELRLVWFYENTIPELFSRLASLVSEEHSPALFARLKSKLNQSRMELLRTFRYVLFSCINPVVENRNQMEDPEVLQCVEEYVEVLTECLADRLFVRDYHYMFNVGQDLDMLAQLSPDMDAEKRSYILEAVLDCLDDPDMLPGPALISSSPSRAPAPEPSTNGSRRENNTEGTSTAAARKVTGVHLDSLISQVKDVLSHLGDGFIKCCLEHYCFVPEDVINAVLESQLPPALMQLDHSMPLERTEVPGAQTVEAGLAEEEEEEEEQRGPEYALAYKGKRRGMFRDVLALINDKSHREECRDFYAQQGLYEDEYDDTYDDHQDGLVADDNDPERRQDEVERLSRQPEVRTRKVPKWRAEAGSQSTGSSSEGSDSEQEGAFVRNPAALRASTEWRRGHGGPARGRDVVGRPRGQGQDKNVTISRNRKTAHKAQRANHNRRAGAAYKRRGGMIPS